MIIKVRFASQMINTIFRVFISLFALFIQGFHYIYILKLFPHVRDFCEHLNRQKNMTFGDPRVFTEIYLLHCRSKRIYWSHYVGTVIHLLGLYAETDLQNRVITVACITRTHKYIVTIYIKNSHSVNKLIFFFINSDMFAKLYFFAQNVNITLLGFFFFYNVLLFIRPYWS